MLISFADSREAEIRKEVAGGNFSTVQSFIKDELNKSPNKRDQNLVSFAIDTAAQNPVWRASFAKEFAREMGMAKAPKFEVFSEEDKSQMRNYTITGGVSGTNIDGLLETTILPVVDGLLWDTNPILSRVSQIPVGLNDGNQSFDLNEFNGEQLAEDLDEDDAGTEADDTVREGDTITPKNKIQASTAFTEYALLTLSAPLLARYVARLVKRVQNRYVYNIFKGSNASNQFKGIINSFGTTVDNQEGALAFADAGATDNVDLLLRSLGDLPDAVTQAEESKFSFYMTRQAFYQKVLPVQDTTTNYKLTGVINDLPGQRSIAGLPVIFTGYAGLGDSVVLADLSNYFVARKGGLRMITDTASIKTGVVTMVAREYADGGMVMAHKNVAGGSADTSDNQARNMFRSVTLGTL